LGLAERADPDASLATLHLERHRDALDGHYFANQLGQIGDRPTQLTRPHLRQRLLLLGRGFVVHDRDHAPVALEDIAGDVDQTGEGAAGDVHALDHATIDMPGGDGVAGASIGIFADPAGAEDGAVADFQQPAFQFVGHDVAPYEWCSFPVSSRISTVLFDRTT